jgi:hypothetical protein
MSIATVKASIDAYLEELKHPNKELPPDYYEKRAKQKTGRLLHFAGRKALEGLQRFEGGTSLTIVPHESVVKAAQTGTSVLVLSTHRSDFLDIGFFVSATQKVGLKYTRPLSKIENIQLPQPVPAFFHRVGLIAIDRGDVDSAGVEQVFGAMKARGQHPLIFPEENRIYENITQVHRLKRTAAMMALMFNMPIAPLAIVGGGRGETVPSRHGFRGRHLQMADHPVAQFGELIRLEPRAGFDGEHLVREAGLLTRTVLTPAMQATLDAAYETRAHLLAAA